MAHDSKMHEPFAIPLEEIVFTVVATDDQLEPVRRSQMSTDLEQHDVVEAVVAFAARAPQIRELRRVFFVGQETASAGRLRVFGEPEAMCEFDLRFAIAAVKSE